jgi:CAAX protease family protein
MPVELKNKWQYTLGRVLLFCLISAVILATLSSLTRGLPNQWSQHLLVSLAAIITFGLTIFFVRLEGLTLNDVGVIPRRGSLLRVGIGFLIGLFLSVLQPVLVLLTGHLEIIPASVSIGVVMLNLLLYFLIALREEIAFRGYPLRSLNYALGSWWAQAVIAIIFSLEHVLGGMTWMHAFLGSGIGAILFGMAAIKTNGIALPIGLHAAWNFGQWCMGFKNEPGIWKTIVEKGFESKVEMNGFISYLVVMIMAILVFYFYKPGESVQKSFVGDNNTKDAIR